MQNEIEIFDLLNDAANGDFSKLHKLNWQEIDINTKDEDGCTILYYAAKTGSLDTIKFLKLIPKK